jgi:hypothetical protein
MNRLLSKPFSQLDRETQVTIAWFNTAPHLSSPECWDCDNWLIRHDDHGKDTIFGWDIDHTIPLASGGPDVWWNVRARNRHNNRSEGAKLGAAKRGSGMPENPLLNASALAEAMVAPFTANKLLGAPYMASDLIAAMDSVTQPTNRLGSAFEMPENNHRGIGAFDWD